MIIEDKDHIIEVWEVVLHLTRYLNPPMQNGVYPRIRPSKREGERIEVNSLYQDEKGGILNILIYPKDKELHDIVAATLDQAITDNINLFLIVNKDQSEGYDHIRLDYEYTDASKRLQRSRKTCKKL